MDKITNGRHEFELVDCVPHGYKVWNIGKNMIDGYLPLVQAGGYNGCQVNTSTMRAIKTDGAQIILAAMGVGPGTVKEMEAYIAKHPGKYGVNRMKAALPYMRQIKGL